MGDKQDFDGLGIAASFVIIRRVKGATCEQFLSRSEPGEPPGQDFGTKIGARVGNAVTDDTDALGQEFFSIGHVVTGEDNAQVYLPGEPVGQGSSAFLSASFQPFSQTGGVPVQDQVFEKRAANEQDQPIAVKGGTFSRGRDVIEAGHAMPETTPHSFQAIEKQAQYFDPMKFSDVFEAFGEPSINMITLDPV
jgi:hypothetical protein